MKMNKLVLLLSMAAMGVSVAQAAAPTAELKVKGVISPGSCTVAAPDNGVYDHGRISADMITATGNGQLYGTEISKNWIITCDADTVLSFKPIDNRSTSSNAKDGMHFGLGFVNSTGMIGSHMVYMKNTSVDGVNVSIAYKHDSKNLEIMYSGGSGQAISERAKIGWGETKAGVATLVPGKVFKAELGSIIYLNSVAGMNGPVTSDVNLDGSLTLNFAYGI